MKQIGLLEVRPRFFLRTLNNKGSDHDMRQHMPTDQSQNTAAYWINHLRLNRHPEGGWFVETYRATETIPAEALPARFDGARSFCTAIHFLLKQGDFSALHRLKSDEMWHFYAGSPLTVHIITPAGEFREIRLGKAPEQGECFQAVVPAGCWFGAETSGKYSLVGCTVAPGFDFSDFEMTGQTTLTALYPQHAALITRMTRS
jgi:predicted cupin superfamily sugar epimerase